MAVATASFQPALFTFLRELRANNNREWFQVNRDRYEADVREPAQAFIRDLAPRLKRLSPFLVADPKLVGGSLLRVNRDIRFSADKTPYRTVVAMSFWHERGRDAAAPVLYLQLGPGESFGGGGVRAPDAAALGRIRDAIATNPAAWRRAVANRGFPGVFSIHGGELKRVPPGYDPDHPFATDLRRKNFLWHRRFTDAEVRAPGFMQQFLDACRGAAGFNRFMAGALGVPW